MDVRIQSIVLVYPALTYSESGSGCLTVHASIQGVNGAASELPQIWSRQFQLCSIYLQKLEFVQTYWGALLRCNFTLPPVVHAAKALKWSITELSSNCL